MPETGLKNIDGYPVEKELGSGASGAVYLVRLPGRQRLAALKLLRNPQTPADVLKFKREFGAIARCSHTNIISVYTFGEYQGFPYFLMEYVKGDDFITAQRRGLRPLEPLSLPRMNMLISAGIQVLDALRYLHGRRIVHQDLKPANIFLTEGNIVKVLDFGLVGGLLGNARNASPSGGTPGYVAPEQAFRSRFDPRSDLYSFGVCLYQALCGIHPFGKFDSWQELIEKQLSSQYSAPSRLHPGLQVDWDYFIGKLLAPDPTQRFQSASQAMAALRRIQEQAGGTAISSIQDAPDWGFLEAPFADTDHIVERTVSEICQNRELLFIFTGPARSGKTRLLSELSGRLADRFPIAHLSCSDHKDTTALFRAFLGILRDTQGVRPPREDPLYNDLIAFFSGDNRTAPREAFNRFGRQFVTFVSENSKRIVSCVVIDDFDKAGDFFVGCIEKLITAVGIRIPFLISCTDSPIHNPAITGRIVEVPRLSIEGTDSITRAMLGTDRVARSLIERLHELSGGLPGLLNDILLAYRDEGSLGFHSNEWWLQPPASSAITRLNEINDEDFHLKPPVLSPTLPNQDRLDREVLRTIAVYEIPCPFSILSNMFAAREELLLEVIDRLIRSDWITESVSDDDVVYQIRHKQHCRYLLDSMTPFHQSYIHRRLADLLSRKTDQITGLSQLLADHYLRSDAPELALPFLERSALTAMKQFDNRRALGLFESIKTVSQRLRELKPLVLPFPSGMVLSLEGFSPTIIESAHQNIQRIAAVKHDLMFINAVRDRGMIFTHIAEYGQAFEEFQRMLARARDIHSTHQEAHALRLIGHVLFYQMKYSEAVKFFEQSLAIRESSEDKQAIADSMNALGGAYQKLDRLDDAIRCFQESLQACETLGDHRGIAFLRNNIGNIRFLKEDYASARDEFQLSLKQLTELGDRQGMAFTGNNLGNALRMLKKHDEAIAAMKTALAIRRETGDLRGAAISMATIGETAHEAGDDVMALEYLSECEALLDELGCRSEFESHLETLKELRSKTNRP